jgi:hypothetical protein
LPTLIFKLSTKNVGVSTKTTKPLLNYQHGFVVL